jgi:anaerobic magnesium-protoporphyrin IX monomethyl ester cyclase
MSDVLLTHSYHLFYDSKQVRKMQPYPPLQTLIAAACLRADGFEVALFDSTFESPEDGFRKALERHRPRLVVICEDNFNFLTKMCLTRNRELAWFMCGAAKEAGVPVAVNSSDASDHVFDYLGHGADFVLIGEVERTLRELAGELLRGSRQTQQIAGLAFRDRARKVRINPRRELMADLDYLPFPAWDLVNVDAYRQAWTRVHGYFSVNMVSSRGCPYRCNWCAKPIYGNSYHGRSARLMAEEMRRVKATLRPDQVWFADDIFALSGRWTREFADAVEALDARIPFKMQSRCDLMTRDTVEALARAGCSEVWMGAESGSQKVLDAMEKDLRVEEIYQARQNLRAHGIRACYFLQFGYPGEEWEDIQRTIRMVRETRPDDIGVSVAYPLPGTKFYQLVEAQLGSKKNWEDSDDLAMMFRGAYTSEFYRALRDALHLEVAGRNRDEIEESWRKLDLLRSRSVSAEPTVIGFGARG